MLQQLYKRLEDSYPEMVKVRRYLHQHPELSFKETKTAAFIADFYRQLGVEVETGVGGNGVVARIHGAKPGKAVAIRADFDALPIQDEKDVPYKSTVPGVMHACGHDGHTAALLILGRALHEIKGELEGTYVLLHQHAEEYAPGGAKPMIEDGCLKGVDVVFGTHLWATVPTGTLQYRFGPLMAAADRFTITIKGKGGHGAKPHETKDALVTGASLVAALQQIVSRRLNPNDPAVITVGSFQSGHAFNIIADSAVLTGTVRSFSEEVRDFIEAEIEQIVKGYCTASRCSYEYLFERGYPAVVPDDETTSFLLDTAKNIDEIKITEESEPEMVGEDFAYYLQKVKGTFFFTGAMPENEDGMVYSHHHPKFDIDEKAMLIAAKTLGTAAVSYQQQPNSTELLHS